MKTNVFFQSNRSARILTLILLASFSLMSCDDDDEGGYPIPMSVCDTDNSAFKQLVDQTMANNGDYELVETMDLAVHSYSFSVSTDKTICRIGYLAQPNLDVDYEIRIIDATNGNQVIYTGMHSFSSTSMTYESVGGVQLTANTEYIIEREYNPGFFNSANIGTLMRDINGNDVAFPMSLGDLTILGSNFYGYGGPIEDVYLPYIDLVFEE